MFPSLQKSLTFGEAVTLKDASWELAGSPGEDNEVYQ